MGTAPSDRDSAPEEPKAARSDAPVRAAPRAPRPGGPRAPDYGSALRAVAIVKHVALALAICASAALVIDYRNAGDPAFCGVQSGCYAVRASAYSHIAGIPLPNLALPAFAILLGLSIYATTAAHHRLVAGAAGVAGLLAVGLIAVQAFFVGAFCPWCVIVDSSAIVAGLASIAIWFWIKDDDRRAARVSVQGRAAGAWAVAGALAIGLPMLWARYPAIPPPPAEITAQQEAGKVTILSYTDFECPFCRKLHPVIDALRAQHGDKIHFVRKMKPLVSHVGAMPAAKAWMCAPDAKKDAVAGALYEMDPEHFKIEELAALAETLDLGPHEAFAACMKAKRTDMLIDRDSQEFMAIKGRGLPYTFVNGRPIIGFNPDKLTTSVEMELDGPPPALPVAGMFAALAAVIAVASAFSWTARSAPAAPRKD